MSNEKDNKKESLRVSRRDFLRQGMQLSGAAMLGSTLPFMGCNTPSQSPNTEQPNVLFLLTDQWRGQALGCAGDPNAKTPNIDKMASRGIHLTHCYSNDPICTPYRSMLMSGRFPTRTGVFKNKIKLPSQEYCLAEAFADAGYATGYIGKWHLDGEAKPGQVRETQGWQYFSGFNRSHHHYDGEAVYWEDGEKHQLEEGVYQAAHQTDRAMEWMGNQAEKPHPWFMMLSWGGPHHPYREIPEDYLEQFDPEELILRENVRENNFWDIPTLRQKLQGYYAQIKGLDDNVGRLLQFLRDTGLEDNTIVILTSDHGDMLLSQGRRYKGAIWEESINVPFVAQWPESIPAGTVADDLFSAIDIYPTLCGLCDISVPPGKDGVDCSHVFLQQGETTQQAIYLTHGKDKWRGIRTQRYTYRWNVQSKKPTHLYDNQSDPYQMNNLINNDSVVVTQQKLHNQLVQYLHEVDDPVVNKTE